MRHVRKAMTNKLAARSNLFRIKLKAGIVVGDHGSISVLRFNRLEVVKLPFPFLRKVVILISLLLEISANSTTVSTADIFS